MYLKQKYFRDIWPLIVKTIMKEGEVIKDERGQNTKEILNLIWTVTNPDKLLPPEMNSTALRIAEEGNQQMIDPKKGEFVYTYGNRLRDYFEDYFSLDLDSTIDQLDSTIKRLNECRESRRATCVTWNPSVDSIVEEVPCMIFLDFKIRHNLLYTTALWRSHDAFGAIPANFAALFRLHSLIAMKTASFMGPITVHSVSAHIYEHDWKEAEKI